MNTEHNLNEGNGVDKSLGIVFDLENTPKQMEGIILSEMPYVFRIHRYEDRMSPTEELRAITAELTTEDLQRPDKIGLVATNVTQIDLFVNSKSKDPVVVWDEENQAYSDSNGNRLDHMVIDTKMEPIVLEALLDNHKYNKQVEEDSVLRQKIKDWIESKGIQTTGGFAKQGGTSLSQAVDARNEEIVGFFNNISKIYSKQIEDSLLRQKRVKV